MAGIENAPGMGNAAGTENAAGLTNAPWRPAQTRAQFQAIAWLRWRILVNGFRRKGGTGELIARILVYPILAAFSLLPILGAGAGAFFFASHAQLGRTAWLLWATFLLCQILNINLGQPGTTFDPRLLIRFPMQVRTYVAIRLFFGLLTPANVIGSLMSLAMAVGVAAAQPRLWLWALIALSIFAITNILFSRMVFAWVDRWLATRRAREVFTAIIFAASLGFQYLNVTFNPAYSHHHAAPSVRNHLALGARVMQQLHPLLAMLPPQLTAASLLAASSGRFTAFVALTAGCALFGAVFLLVFAFRMRTEFGGENLSDSANALGRAPKHPKPAHAAAAPAVVPPRPAREASGVPPVIAAVMGKELLYLRRNLGLFYSLIAPVVMVFLFAGRLAGRSASVWIYPAALAYTLLGVVPLSYNSFGLEGAGVQFYFLAPVRLRDVALAKNLLNLLLAAVEVLAVLAVVTYLTHLPSPRILVAGTLWALATLLLSMTIGNRRSIGSPKRIDPARTASKQASPLSALLSMGVLLACAVLGMVLLAATEALHARWALVPASAVLLAAMLPLYLQGLRGLDRYARDHRESLFAELCKS